MGGGSVRMTRKERKRGARWGPRVGDGQTIAKEVAPGTYTSGEWVPAGWALTALSCDDSDSTGSLGSATATFHVAAGETVTCTFTDTKQGRIVVKKVTVPVGDPGSLDRKSVV